MSISAPRRRSSVAIDPEDRTSHESARRAVGRGLLARSAPRAASDTFVTPAVPMRALGLMNRTVREIDEMRHEVDEPCIVDATRAETELSRATPLAGTRARIGAELMTAHPLGRSRVRKPERHARREGER